MSDANLNGVVEVPRGPQRPTETGPRKIPDQSPEVMTLEKVLAGEQNSPLSGKTFPVSGELLGLMMFFSSEFKKQRFSITPEERNKIVGYFENKYLTELRPLIKW